MMLGGTVIMILLSWSVMYRNKLLSQLPLYEITNGSGHEGAAVLLTGFAISW